MPLSTLCQHCGLCCDGTLFTVVPLQPAEETSLRARGLAVVTRADGSPALPQRCAALAGRSCTLYTERPQGCRRYQCQLYTALAEGEVDLAEALAVVEQAHSLLEAPTAERGPRVEGFLDRHFRGRHRSPRVV
ncbi:MAG TPA: YkgJ family cysteine cluster protein [Myxococcaceae bacterium]|nr:YkgJ family cysteine cluster protein [Myxococcaceae bacterium]